ncbi:hypothetical protein BU15DRAFT_78869 [Melanogaster broomeanus]|nr:hypothetical protein BU15DRAFT_78869 [Melanogaster broomeanus]
MAAYLLQMPFQGRQDAPKFDGKVSAELPRFLEDINLLGTTAGLPNDAKIRAAIHYADLEEAEVWEYLPSASGNDWDAFVTEVKKLYPGCEGSNHFLRADLEYLVSKYRQKPMQTRDDLGEYQRKFTQISAFLISKGRLAYMERDHLFLRGFPSGVASLILHRVYVVNPNLHPDDPCPMEEVSTAAQFLLSGSALRAPHPIPQPSYQPPIIQHQSPTPIHQFPMPTQQSCTTTQQPLPGGMAKQKLPLQSRNPRRSGICNFCAGWGHHIRDCIEVEAYILAGKIFRTSDRKLYLPEGQWIPRDSRSSCMKASIDYWFETNMIVPTLTTPSASSTQGSIPDLLSQVTTGILVRSGPEAEVEVKPESFANLSHPSDTGLSQCISVDDPVPFR